MEKTSAMDSPPPFVSNVIDSQAQTRCLGMLANLEGLKQANCPEFNDSKTDIHVRVCALEDMYKITPPPPMQENDWDSLAWRIRRIDKRCEGLQWRRTLTNPAFDQLVADPTHITMDKIHEIMASIKKLEFCKPWPKAEGKVKDEDAELSKASQRLCFIAGSHRIRLVTIPATEKELYAAAVEVALEAETPNLGAFPPPPGGFRPWAAPCRRPGCICSCHSRPPLPPPPGAHITPRCRRRASFSSVSSSSSSSRSSTVRKPSLMKRVFGFGWLRPLACWRKKRVVDDDSSYMSD